MVKFYRVMRMIYYI